VEAADWNSIKNLYEAARQLPAEAREALLRASGASPGVLVEVRSLLAVLDAAADFIETPALASLSADDKAEVAEELGLEVPLMGTRIGPYDIERELGRGGMGVVYQARRVDGEYRQIVAIKVVRAGMDSAAVLRRFRAERQILATLIHPNIARLLDGGRLPDGRPYLVLEYVNGTPITTFCDDRQLPLPARLALFCGACAAVDHAHQAQVIHRDIKPGNILVTADGTPKLLDFGIAKLLTPGDSEGADLTHTLGRVLTPEYAAPEQVRGDPVSVATDVYALGVVLHELLTGRRPRHDAPAPAAEASRPSTIASTGLEDTAAVSAARATSPTKLAQALRGDLDAIVLTAIRHDPSERYPSAHHLADDVERYLHGRPIAARKYGWRYGVARFIRRHRTAVVAVGVAIGAGTAATLWQGYEADRERARAVQLLQEARDLAGTLLFDDDDAAPGAIVARERLVTRALTTLDRLADQATDDVALQRQLAAAYVRIGDVQSRLHGPNLGDTAGALHSYARAKDIGARLVRAHETDPDLRLDLAVSEIRLGDAVGKMGRAADALEQYRTALSQIAQVVAADPSSVRGRDELSRAHRMVGQALLKAGDLDGALARFDEARTIREHLVAEHPANLKYRRDLGAVHQSIGFTRTEQEDHEGALRSYQTFLTMARAVAAAAPDDPVMRRHLMQGYWWTGIGWGGVGNARESLRHLARAFEIAQAAWRADPRNVQARNDLADAYMERGNAHSLAGTLPAALADYRDAIVHYRAIADSDPTNRHAPRQVQYTAQHLAAAQAAAGNRRGALATYRDTVKALTTLSAADPTNAELQLDLVRSHRRIAELLLRDRAAADAIAALTEARRLLEPLARRFPTNRRIERDLAWVVGQTSGRRSP
jgi:tetratricopeptide (TPR) repeat protein